MGGEPEKNRRRKSVKVVFLILAIVCLAYYVVIASYAGNSSNFIKIWLAAGIFFLCVFGAFWAQEKYGIFQNLVIPSFLKKAVAACLIVVVTVFVVVEAFIFSGMVQKPDSGLDYLIVLGAHVRGETPSRALYKRLERAQQYLKENPETKVVVSGGKGKGEDITEAEAMRRYLEEQGIEPERILMEERSTSTKENMQFSMEIIKDYGASVGVVTNDFHVFRGISIGKKLGCTNIQGVPAKGDMIMEVNYLVRECFAVIKDKIVGNI